MINYRILNEIISSTIVYDQDANRSRGFILASRVGGSLEFHYMLYSVSPICGCMDLYLDLFQDFIFNNVDSVICDGNLERINAENICP